MAIENTTYISYLIEISKAGRQRGFLELCEINLRNVFTIVYRLLNDLGAAKRITIATFLKVWDEIKEFPSHKPFAPWIKSLAIILAMEELDKIKRYESEPQKPSPNFSDVELLEFYIKQLSVQERIIFVLHDLEGYAYREIKYYFPDLIEDEIKTILIQTRQLLMKQLSL